ncbi:MAG TPA: FAD-dependent oxidoreductase [Ktedonobacteraceae bacterium]|nr:FAD-dependent oxidoreductase [Ktedonobacteraceae bacterium]
MVVGDVTTAVDVLVLGAGPAGYVAAIRAAQLGHAVTLVEAERAGGTCLHKGCIPLKALLSASERYQQTSFNDLATFGIHAERVTFDWPTMQAWKQGVVNRLADGVRRLISGRRIELVKGTGWFINNKEVRVEGEYGSHRFKFSHCIIATGAEPTACADLPYDGEQILSPEQALSLPTLPANLVISGDDYVALELATVFARLGVKVKLCAPGEQFLPGVDPVAFRLVQAGLRKLGIQLEYKQTPTAILERPLLLSHGVHPCTAGLHLADANVQTNEQGGIVVNTMLQSSQPQIYAIGDCATPPGAQPSLASLAMKQGKIAAEVIAGQRVQFSPLVVPHIVHTTPELATAGLTAEQAEHTGYRTKVGRFPLAANGRALTLGCDAGIALLVADATNDVLLGATLVGPRAGDMIGQLSLAIEMGATLTDLSEIIFAHPNLSETIQESADNALGYAIHLLPKI